MRIALLSRLVAAFLIATLGATAIAQQPPALSKNASAIKRKVERLAPHSPISVIRVKGGEEFGELLSTTQDGFTFRDIDRKTDVTLNYAEVRNVKKGYGGYNYARGRHTDRRKNLIVAAIGVATIGALLGALAAAKN